MSQRLKDQFSNSDSDIIHNSREVESDNVSDLGQDIWKRYRKSPGILDIPATMEYTRKVSRLGVGRLPLLSNVLRRWTNDGKSFIRGDWPPMPFTIPFSAPGNRLTQNVSARHVQQQASQYTIMDQLKPKTQSDNIQRKVSSSGSQIEKPILKDKKYNTTSLSNLLERSGIIEPSRHISRMDPARQEVIENIQQHWLNRISSERNDIALTKSPFVTNPTPTELDIQLATEKPFSSKSGPRKTNNKFMEDTSQLSRRSPLIHQSSNPLQKPVVQARMSTRSEPGSSFHFRDSNKWYTKANEVRSSSEDNQITSLGKELTNDIRFPLPPSYKIPQINTFAASFAPGFIQKQTQFSVGDVRSTSLRRQPSSSPSSSSFSQDDQPVSSQAVGDTRPVSTSVGVDKEKLMTSEIPSRDSLDEELLIDRVLHKLLRRIAVEQERRGVSQWL